MPLNVVFLKIQPHVRLHNGLSVFLFILLIFGVKKHVSTGIYIQI